MQNVDFGQADSAAAPFPRSNIKHISLAGASW